MFLLERKDQRITQVVVCGDCFMIVMWWLLCDGCCVVVVVVWWWLLCGGCCVVVMVLTDLLLNRRKR